MHGRRHTWSGHVHGGGHAWQGCVDGGGGMDGVGHAWCGACMAGGMHGGGHAWQEIRPLQQTVRFLLECILVKELFEPGINFLIMSFETLRFSS